MTDIVEQLRALARAEHDDLSVADEAADAIERLQAELAELAKPVFLACPIDSPANEAEAWRAILDERTKRAAAAIRERTDGH